MEDIITGILKGATYIFRVCLENGIWDLSIRKPGRIILRIIWPPYWINKVTYEGSLIIVLGISFWLVLAYLFYFVTKLLGF